MVLTNRNIRHAGFDKSITKEDLSLAVRELWADPVPHSSNRRTTPAYRAVGAIFSTIRLALLRGETVTIKGFGRFELVTYPARKVLAAYEFSQDHKLPTFTSKSPRQWLTKPAHRTVRFTPYHNLLEYINE